MDVSSSGGASVNSRWSPTREQISMLESFYSQGIRTPSTEMIEQIASRLKAYGHIEGKNVFYWFQNHKARQRQKQKQENMAYINKYLHKAHQPVFAPPCRNGLLINSYQYYYIIALSYCFFLLLILARNSGIGSKMVGLFISFLNSLFVFSFSRVLIYSIFSFIPSCLFMQINSISVQTKQIKT